MPALIEYLGQPNFLRHAQIMSSIHTQNYIQRHIRIAIRLGQRIDSATLVEYLSQETRALPVDVRKYIATELERTAFLLRQKRPVRSSARDCAIDSTLARKKKFVLHDFALFVRAEQEPLPKDVRLRIVEALIEARQKLNRKVEGQTMGRLTWKISAVRMYRHEYDELLQDEEADASNAAREKIAPQWNMGASTLGRLLAKAKAKMQIP